MGSHSTTLRRHQRAVGDFANALSALLSIMEPRQRFGCEAQWVAKPGMNAEAANLALQVDSHAGRAGYALAEAGTIIEWKPRGTMATRPVIPAQAWRTIFEDDPMFGPEMIFACCAQADGILDAQASAAEENEQSLAGRIGYAVSFFDRVRGKLRSERRQGFIGGLVTATIPLLLAGYIVHLFGWA